MLEDGVASFVTHALDRLGLTARKTELLPAATVMEDQADIAWELFISLLAVRERLARLQAKLGVRTAADPWPVHCARTRRPRAYRGTLPGPAGGRLL